MSVNPVISLPVRSHRKAKVPANCNQNVNTSFHKEMNSQPAVVPLAVNYPGAEAQTLPTPLGGKGVHPLPPLPPEEEGEDQGEGERTQGNLIREKKEGEMQRQVDLKPKPHGNHQKSFNSGRNNNQSKLATKKMMLSILIACGAMAGLMLKPVSGYS
ncbi:MAG: hypothetical protein GY696_34380 [Gammaproteobacteria bacterium]|nr:hypothetical protein [Gammaproteobacteria bacterium]